MQEQGQDQWTQQGPLGQQPQSQTSFWSHQPQDSVWSQHGGNQQPQERWSQRSQNSTWQAASAQTQQSWQQDAEIPVVTILPTSWDVAAMLRAGEKRKLPSVRALRKWYLFLSTLFLVGWIYVVANPTGWILKPTSMCMFYVGLIKVIPKHDTVASKIRKMGRLDKRAKKSVSDGSQNIEDIYSDIVFGHGKGEVAIRTLKDRFCQPKIVKLMPGYCDVWTQLHVGSVAMLVSCIVNIGVLPLCVVIVAIQSAPYTKPLKAAFVMTAVMLLNSFVGLTFYIVQTHNFKNNWLVTGMHSENSGGSFMLAVTMMLFSLVLIFLAKKMAYAKKGEYDQEVDEGTPLVTGVAEPERSTQGWEAHRPGGGTQRSAQSYDEHDGGRWESQRHGKGGGPDDPDMGPEWTSPPAQDISRNPRLLGH